MRAFFTVAGLALVLAGCSGAKPEESGASEQAAAPEVSAAPVAYASLTGDAAKGEKLFMQCKACHAIEPGKNIIGPSLHGVVGRTAGQVPGFNYSPANKASGEVWSEDHLYAFIEAPQKVIPGTRMAYFGMRKPQDRADLIAYLKTVK
ncbi:c-type cytochrome [Sphingobium boeckii]|uniref:Cytochrome c n=1 Tax=Sphingobium boeckii TaxID=1082345 RepID=A0A7W9AJH9_9SPHN|nr:cytochrome c family protein [Sphingobium boeckii]MBB5686592.1 cytochrome c [Sphingobium boeckii]